ncbi:uncharacterized protein LOC126998863 [Eriocheir sinensis]|uniref:uncharacterized protein LOC126998863 n=1 Tax=Eriocheir sinensis TaxID=95602 RepID=UPI0021C69FF5|nr:uncharacterized protein LOC126998863 [Eriocheir sinensis]XP_050717000.1 uncharacterized protein LOC126998863 [Eriocheir sinensis]
MKLGVASPAGVWVVVVVVLLGVGVEQPPGTEGAAAPHGCCRRGRFAAVALGFIGGFVVGRHGGHHHGGCGGCGGGCGGCYGGCGWCGGGHYGRKRRSLDEVMERDIIEAMFEKFASQDKDQCGLRLVCELAQKDPNYLTGDETLILLPYRGRDESDEQSFYGRYDKAVWHGQHGSPCKKLFPLCPYTAPQIMGEVPTNATNVTF